LFLLGDYLLLQSLFFKCVFYLILIKFDDFFNYVKYIFNIDKYLIMMNIN